eukprot:TRINITY_DN30875_c0_g1_i1.p1 TRINITY_DN30875_c0_g1~~TRINITY_DN30875_c0_g1_i1.p1  ORF type:complete len:342 (+),score=81.28 TRINITY_DN30875_c0_g1_i1:915-1940(+)
MSTFPTLRRVSAWVKRRWVDVVVTLAFAGAGFALSRVNPVPRFFTERDQSLAYPYIPDAHASVPTWLLVVVAVIIPLLIIVGTQLFLIVARPPTDHDLHRKLSTDIPLAILALGHTLAVTFFVTSALKCFVGRLRPNFYGMCNYKGYDDAMKGGDLASYLNRTVAGTVGSFDHCWQSSQQLIYESRFSFPSGHSSISMAGLTFLGFFLVWVIAIFKPSRHNQLSGTVFIVPVLAAAIVAATRVKDYWHQTDDVILGSLIGLGVAFWSFRLYYPSGCAVVLNKMLRPDNSVPEPDAAAVSAGGSDAPLTTRQRPIDADGWGVERDNVTLPVWTSPGEAEAIE